MRKVLAILLAASMMLATVAGCSTPGSSSSQEPGSSEASGSSQAPAFDKQIDTDVVVVGGGGAGISAAIAAAQQGKKVVLLEKVGYLGGATLMSGGLIPAVGTKQQVEAGIDDNLEWFVRDMMRPNNYSARPDLVYTVAEQAKPTIEWLEGLGVQFSVVTNSLYYGQSNYRMHLAEGKGKGLTEKMIAALEGMENITVMLNTPGTGLATNEAGEVTGVYAESATDGKLYVAAQNTVLASSGFAANKEMLAKYMPEIVNAYPLVAPGATGEGILWAQELGAQVSSMGAYQGHAFYSEEFGGSMDQSIMTRGGIFVNINGVRFTNEYGGYSELAPHVLAQPDGHAFIVLNEANAANTANFKAYQDKGVVFSGNTPEELADATGMNKEALVKTIAKYKESIQKGEDEFNRTKLPTSFDGPYYAIRVTADLRHTQGGVVTDVATHVLTEDGQIIKGLYAAGGVTESFSSDGGAAYMSGNGLLQAIIFGKLAGENAAKETPATAQAATWQKPEQEITGKLPEAAASSSESAPAAPASYKDGEYEGEAKGHTDLIKVKVTVSGGKITAVTVTAQAETEAIYKSAEQPVIDAIVKNNGTAGVDAVSGATHSSDGIKGAVDNALSKAA